MKLKNLQLHSWQRCTRRCMFSDDSARVGTYDTFYMWVRSLGTLVRSLGTVGTVGTVGMVRWVR